MNLHCYFCKFYIKILIMAIVKFKDGSRKLMPDPIVEKIWAIKNGYITPTAAQKDFVDTIAIAELNWRNAPDEYIRQNLTKLLPFITMSWIVDLRGQLVRPMNGPDYDFAVKWGLYRNGHPTEIVTGKQIQMLYN